MRVWQVHHSAHPTLTKLWAVLQATPPADPQEMERHGDLGADIAAGAPVENRVNAVIRHFASMASLRDAAHAVADGLEIRGTNYYPAGGGMGWHTNSDRLGWRAYLVRAPGGRSYFGHKDGVLPDRDGYANVFKVSARSWHYVRAETERWSIGLRLLPEVVIGLIGREAVLGEPLDVR